MSLFEVFQHKNMLHAAAVHMPIVLAMVGMPLVVLALVFRRVLLFRVLAVAVYLLMAGSAYYAEHTGEGARSLVSSALGVEVWDLIDRHEAMAARVKNAALVTAVLLLLAMVPKRKIQIALSMITACSALAGFYLVTMTAHDGGTLVYHHGVGTPFRETMTPGMTTVFPTPHVVHPAPVQPTPATVPGVIEAPIVIPAPAVEMPVAVTSDPVALPVEPAPAAPEPPAEVPAVAPAAPVAMDPSALSMSVEAPAQLANTAPIPAEAPAQQPNTGVIPVAAVLNNPDWIPVREIDLAEAEKLVFSKDIWPLIEEQCFDCHSAPEPDGGYEMGTREALLKRGEKAGAGVIPGDPDNSAIIHYIRGIMQPRMPKKSPPLSEDQLHLLRSWIAAGAVVDAEPGA